MTHGHASAQDLGAICTAVLYQSHNADCSSSTEGTEEAEDPDKAEGT